MWRGGGQGRENGLALSPEILFKYFEYHFTLSITSFSFPDCQISFTPLLWNPEVPLMFIFSCHIISFITRVAAAFFI